MKTKKVKTGLLILAILVFSSYGFFSFAQEKTTSGNNIFADSDQDGLSDQEEKAYGTNPTIADTDGDSFSDGAEILAGTNPLDRSDYPGHHNSSSNSAQNNQPATAATTGPNLTEEATKKVSEMIDASSQNGGNVSVNQLTDVVTQITDSQSTINDFPQISPDEIKIKKQDYKNLSSEKATAKKKEDFMNYIVGLAYIFSSNSPKPITSTSDVENLSTSIPQEILSAMTSGDPNSISDLTGSAQKTLDQMKSLEVPEEIVAMHTKGLQLAKYAVQMKDKIAPNSADPMQTVVDYSRMTSLADAAISFSGDAQALFVKYGLQESDLQPKLASYGIDITTPDSSTTSPTDTTATITSTTTAN